MPIMKSFECSKHGEFEAFLMNSEDRARCPHYGCRCKPKELPSGPSLFSDRTKGYDTTLKGLAQDFKMTDIKSTREGESQSGYHTRNNKPQRDPDRPGSQAIWGNSGAMNMGHIMKGGAFRSVRGENVGVRPSDLGATVGPRAASYIADHENLKIEK